MIGAFPTPVGMNRCLLRRLLPRRAFPTPVGMNRFEVAGQFRAMGVPHTRGDEPGLRGTNPHVSRRSPHPWG